MPRPIRADSTSARRAPGRPSMWPANLSKMATGVKLEPVQYRGEGPALADLLGGQVDFVFATPAASIEYIRAGRLRALAVMSASRAPVLPEVPAITDYAAGAEASFWTGLC